MGYSVLCYAGRKLIAIHLLSYSRSMIQGDDVTYKIAVGDDSRNYFARNGTLDNQYDPNIRAINNQYAVFAIARDLGTIQVTQASVVWTVGYTTDFAINYTDLSGAPPTPRRPYYKIKYSSDADLASIYGNCWGYYISNIKSRSQTSSTISAVHIQELSSWTTRYSKMPAPSRMILEAWSLSPSPKYTAVCS